MPLEPCRCGGEKYRYAKRCKKCFVKECKNTLHLHLRLGKFSQKGNIPWNIRENPSYRAIHIWVQKHLGRPEKCSKCPFEGCGRKIHWANKSGKYKRNLSDWIRLCSKCHGQYDKENKLRKRKLKTI